MAPIRPALREAGLTEQQWRVLRVLVDEGDTDPSGLAEAGLLYAPSVTRILKELVDRGLIVRTLDPTDGRRSIITATANGRALVETTARKTAVILQAYAESFGPERLAALQGELRELVGLIGPGRPGREGLQD
ncbi:MAG: transcriptional regulator, MarR family [Caulobacteraceae bacterium]|nr:transcriptional regulator, MarR family [Caulobacteraceae bacterium]